MTVRPKTQEGIYRAVFFSDEDVDSVKVECDASTNRTNMSNGTENKTGANERQKQPAGACANSSTQHNSTALNGSTVDADRHVQAWRDFVKAANENGRNNSMMSLFGRWV